MAASTTRRWLIGIAATLLLALVLVVAGVLAWLVPQQRRLMYFPREYTERDAIDPRLGVAPIYYKVGGKAQVSFFVPPRKPPGIGEAPPIIVLFNGNGSLALDWLASVKAQPRDDVAFFLVEYPGYGMCEGSPSRASIIQGMDAAWNALAEQTGLSVARLDRDVSTMGFSMGSAAALEFAARRPVRKVVLLAPFTSLHDMAERQAGGFVAMFLLDRFDNRARLDDLAKRPTPPSVLVCHGANDSVIPVAMGRELGTRHPKFTRFMEFPGVDHGDLPVAAAKAIVAEFTGTWPDP